MAAGRLFAKEDRRRFSGETVDIPFLILTLLLLIVGLVMLYSASSAQSMYDTGYAISTKYLQKQAVCAGIGLVCMWIFSRIPASFWLKFAWPLYGISIVLLLLVLVAGESVNGARRWINIAGLQFQPSEIAKFTMIVLFAKLTKSFGADARKFRYGVLGFGGALLGILIPLALEKHLSAIMLMGMVAVVIMFVAGTHPKWLLMGAGFAVVFVVVYVTFMGYAGDRITAWLHPESDPSDKGYQILQSLYAIGSGGLFGLGFGKSRQKYLYLPFQYNDYIFAIVCEEHAGILDRASCIGPVFHGACHRFGGAHRSTDHTEPMCGHKSTAVNRNCPSVFLLRRYGTDHAACGNGRAAEYFPSVLFGIKKITVR